MKIAIVGGTGKMGQWLARFLQQDGEEVVLIGRDGAKLEEAGRQLDVKVTTDIKEAGDAGAVIISVPIDSFEEVTRRLAPHIHPSQIIMDITSVKVMPVEAMHRHIKRGRVLGTHPVFGPGARGVAGHNIVLTPTDDKESALAERVKTYLEARGAKVQYNDAAGARRYDGGDSGAGALYRHRLRR